MDGLLQLGGLWLARLYAVYGFLFLLIPGVLFAYVPLLAAAVWAVASHARGRQPWPRYTRSASRAPNLTVHPQQCLRQPRS
jgi:hypothetical protein